MNTFVLLACIAAYATQLSLARSDVSLGYRYQSGYNSAGGNLLQSPHSTSNNYFSTAPAFPANVDGYGGSPSTSSRYGALSGSYGGAGDFGGSSMDNSYQSDYGSGNRKSVYYAQQASNFNGQAPIVTKHFWLHSAAEDHDEQEIVRYINIGKPRKNYNVVFINTPSSNVNKAKIVANVAPIEDKTVIYVLAKKANTLDVSAEVATPAPIVNKPEVFFIKYKTADEAAHAQHTIQAQYDALGGSSNLSNEGNIPVSSAIGSLGGSVGIGADNGDDHNAGDSSHSNYLPPNP